jgi:hypothetical protein
MRGPVAAVAALAACALAAGVASAQGLPPDPAANISLGRMPAACERAPSGPVCENGAIRSLDAARAKLGLPRYLLPADFVTLKPARQWLILCNLDRVAYRLRPVRGLALPLDKVARAGALAHADPDPSALLRSLSGQSTLGFASNWAGGQPNALVAYFGWMYDDGYGGPNVDCSSPSAPGCWGHRHDILAFSEGGALTMGAATVRAERSYALTIVETSRAPWPYAYTWAQAKRDGADSAQTVG